MRGIAGVKHTNYIRIFIKFALSTVLVVPIVLPAFVATAGATTVETPRVTFKNGNNPGPKPMALIDVNGDGRKDFVFGGLSNGTPNSYPLAAVVFNTPDLPSVVDLSNIGTLGFYITATIPNQNFGSSTIGTSIVDAGDLNGDGRHEILLSNSLESHNSPYDLTNHADIIWGKSDTSTIDLMNMTSAQGVRFDATNPTNPVTMNVAVVGDMNGDGYPELAFGDFAWGGSNLQGKVTVVFGRASWPASINLDTASQDGNGFNIFGKNGSSTGYSISSAGDFNGDGLMDIAVTAPDDVNDPTHNLHQSAEYVIFGSRTPTDVNLSSLGSQGIRMYATHNRFISYVTGSGNNGPDAESLGDVNNDSLGDISIMSSNGNVWTVYGKTDATEVDLENLGSQGTTTIASSAFDGGANIMVRDGGSLNIGNDASASPGGDQSGGRIYGVPVTSFIASQTNSNVSYNYVIEGASANMNLGAIIAEGSSGGELLTSVSSDAGYVAAVVPARGAVIALPGTTPSFPTNLTATSPAQYPSLSWTASSGATSYNIYRNSTNVGSTSNTSYPDNTAPEGTDTYYVTAVNSGGESGPSNSVNVLVDRTSPTITYSVSPTPNSSGWNNTSPVTVTFTCNDNVGGSGIASCSPAQTESADGIYTLTGTAVDKAGNSSTVSVTVNLDQTAPTLGTPSWTNNPMTTTQSTTVTVPVSDNLSGVLKGEYYLGTTDPGQGSGTAMTLNNGNLSTSFNNQTPGIYTINFRAEDTAGNWSPVITDYLVVYDTTKTSADGHSGDIEPVYGTDVLPGLLQTGQHDKEHFAFTVKYKNGTLDPASTVHFDYKTGTHCNNPNQATNCHNTTLDATSIAWMVINGTNNSVATIQGTATLTIDGATTTNPFRVITTDGSLLNPQTTDQFELDIYAPGANPNTAQPIYHLSDPLAKGNVVVKS